MSERSLMLVNTKQKSSVRQVTLNPFHGFVDAGKAQLLYNNIKWLLLLKAFDPSNSIEAHNLLLCVASNNKSLIVTF